MSGIVTQNVLGTSGLIKSPDVGGGAWNFISKQTASADSTIDFTSGIDSTYKEYLFTFNNIHPSEDGGQFSFNFTTDGTNYNATKTSTAIECYHKEDDSNYTFLYRALGLAQSTGNQVFMVGIGNDNDQSGVGYLQLYNPSSTTFVKHFIADCNFAEVQDMTFTEPTAGYINTTSAVTGARFLMHSGNIDSGDICLYGLTT